jgi:HAD superfamily hydrolase (TIGR01509 family)
MQIRTVFLDAGGVLVHPNWERVSETLARHGCQISPEALRTAEPILKKRLDTHEISRPADEPPFNSYFRHVIVEAGVFPNDVPPSALNELREYDSQWNMWDYVADDVLPTLRQLRAMNLQLAVVSNSNGTLHRLLERVGVASAFDHIFDSHVEGLEKPDPEYFRRALVRTGATAETAIHVGDFYHIDVVGARSAGLHAIMLDPADLYPECDAPRIRSISELIEALK